MHDMKERERETALSSSYNLERSRSCGELWAAHQIFTAPSNSGDCVSVLSLSLRAVCYKSAAGRESVVGLVEDRHGGEKKKKTFHRNKFLHALHRHRSREKGLPCSSSSPVCPGWISNIILFSWRQRRYTGRNWRKISFSYYLFLCVFIAVCCHLAEEYWICFCLSCVDEQSKNDTQWINNKFPTAR